MSFTQALCVGKHELFDSTHPDDHARAARLCAACPLIDDCQRRLKEAYAAVKSGGTPEGTWAGRLLGPARDRERLDAESAAFSDDEARRARAAHERGDTSPWAAMGTRVYWRRRKRPESEAS